MDATESPSSAPRPGEPTDRAVLEFLAWRSDRLQTLFQFSLAALILLSAALNIFLYKQMRLVRIQIPSQREAAIRYGMEFSKRDDVTIRSFVTKLEQFAAANPDFRPILDHYRPHLSAYFLSVGQKVVPASQAPAGTNK